MKLRDFFKQFDEPKHGGNRGVVPDRGHAPSVTLTQIIKDQRGFNYKLVPGDFKGKPKFFSGTEPVSPNVGDIWYKKNDIGGQMVQWDGERWMDTFTKQPISGLDCSKVIEGRQLEQTADKANDDRTLAKNVRQLNALLAKEAAQGNYSCEVRSDFFSANIGALIMAMTVQGIKAEVENDIVYMSWKGDK